jgi:hypothetical protein
MSGTYLANSRKIIMVLPWQNGQIGIGAMRRYALKQKEIILNGVYDGSPGTESVE